jgi:hypothetical protein
MRNSLGSTGETIRGLDREFLGGCDCLRPKILTTRLETLLPSLHMHRRNLCIRRLSKKQVERLGLTNEWRTGCSHINQNLLWNFPSRFVDCPKFTRNLQNGLNASVVRHNGCTNLGVPKIQLHKILHKILIHDHEIPRKNSACLQIGCERLKALIVSKNLGGRSRRHWGNQKRIACTVGHCTSLKTRPIQIGNRLLTPQIELELALGKG